MAALGNTQGSYFIPKNNGPERTRIQGAAMGETDGAMKVIASLGAGYVFELCSLAITIYTVGADVATVKLRGGDLLKVAGASLTTMSFNFDPPIVGGSANSATVCLTWGSAATVGAAVVASGFYR